MHWDKSTLEEYATQSDPEADALVSRIIEQQEQGKMRSLFDRMITNRDLHHDAFSDLPLEEYFQDAALPEWADPAKLLLAEEVYRKHGMYVSMILSFRSLPLCYTAKKGAMALYDTGRLTEHDGKTLRLAHRLMETSQMVMNVMAPDAWKPEGKAIVTVKKVRLLHASIRYYLKSEKYNPKGWDVAQLGEPINQMYMAGTLAAFSSVVLGGLELMRVELSDREKDAYMHAWKLVGYFIGLDPALWTDTYAENHTLAKLIIKSNFEASLEGRELTASLLDFCRELIPGRLVDGLPAYLLQFFVKNVSEELDIDIMENLGVRKESNLVDRLSFELMDGLGNVLDKFMDESKVVAKIMGSLQSHMMQGIIDMMMEHKKVEFDIPPSLKKDWDL